MKILLGNIKITSDTRAGGPDSVNRNFDIIKFSNVKVDILRRRASSDSEHRALLLLKEVLNELPGCWNLDLVINISYESTADRRFFKGYLEVVGKNEICCLHAFNQLGKHEAVVVVKFKEDIPMGITLETSEMKVSPKSGKRCVGDAIKLPIANMSRWQRGASITGQLKILITFSNDTAEITNATSLTRCILEQEVHSDVVIVAGNGAELKAHKNFLVAQSSVFESMFEIDMREAEEHTIEIPDMTEEGVRAFLKFLYYQGTNDAAADSAIAFELLRAGHKYDIKSLEDTMAALMMKQPCEWFTDADIAVKLFLFARNLTPVNESLKVKAIQILKRNSHALQNCAAFQELFRTDATAAKDICMYTISM